MPLRDVIDSYFTAINTEDWALLETLWHEDSTYSSTGSRPRSGKADVLGFFHGAFKAWSEHEDRAVNVIADGDAAAVEVTFLGTTLDGRPITFDAIDIFKFRGGKLVSGATWYDLAAVRKMLETPR